MVELQNLPMFVVDFSTSLLSLASCLWLLRSLCGLPKAVRHRLFPRQALWLCGADIAYATCKLVARLRWSIAFDMCDHWWLVMSIMSMSYLMEMFICLGFACQAAKWTRSLRLLRYSGGASLILSAALVFLEPWRRFYGKSGEYSCRAEPGTMDIVNIVLTGSCLAISFGCFVFVHAKTRGSPDAVHTSVSIRCAAYSAKSLILMMTVISWFGLADRVFILIAMIVQNLNGAANAATYYFQSRYAQPTIHDLKTTRADSFRVAFSVEVQTV
jgi:hypothetical protein